MMEPNKLGNTLGKHKVSLDFSGSNVIGGRDEI